MDKQKQEFFASVAGISIHVLRSLYQEVIDKVEDDDKRKKFQSEFDEKVLPEAEVSGKRLMFGGKTYVMFFSIVDEKYKLSEQMEKINKEDMSLEDKNLLTMDRDVTICSPMNFQRILSTQSKDFFNKLVVSLPKDPYIRDIALKFDEEYNVYYIYPDSKVRFGLTVDEVDINF